MVASPSGEEGAAPGMGQVGGSPGAMVGASAIVEGFGAVLGSGAAGEPASGARTFSDDAARAPEHSARPGGQDAPRRARRPDSRRYAVGASLASRPRSGGRPRQFGARSMSKPARLWLSRSLVMIWSLLRDASAAVLLHRPARPNFCRGPLDDHKSRNRDWTFGPTGYATDNIR